MKLSDALSVGYRITRYKGVLLTASYTDVEAGVVYLKARTADEDLALSLDKEVEELDIDLALRVAYHPDVVSGLLVSDVAPLPKEVVKKSSMPTKEVFLENMRRKHSLFVE